MSRDESKAAIATLRLLQLLPGNLTFRLSGFIQADNQAFQIVETCKGLWPTDRSLKHDEIGKYYFCK
jgi:hypothetical protein